MADFELSVQMENGAFQSGSLDLPRKDPAVFNTGQVLFGLAQAYRETGEEKYRKAAKIAAEWLVEEQDCDGAWRKHLSSLATGAIHVYNTRTARGLLEIYDITSNEIFLNAAIKNIRWALTQQLDNGWFSNAGFNVSEVPLSHTIAYAVEGLLECGIYLKNKAWNEAAAKSANALLLVQRKDGSLFGRYNSDWKNTVKWSCLTGNAQVAIIWLRLFDLTGDRRYLDAASKINQNIKSNQDLESPNKGIKGGVKGSNPIYGGYGPFYYPNWAAKFFLDSLLLEDNLKSKVAKIETISEHK
jgi:uncharacterized protein YyaL (SSP411 family)